MPTYRMNQTNSYPLVITNSKGKALVTINDDGSVQLDGNPNEAAKIFWSAFSALFDEAIKAHLEKRAPQFNADILEALKDGKA